MAKTGFVDVPAGQQPLFDVAVQTGDPFVHGNVIAKTAPMGKLKAAETSARSLLQQCAELWAGFDSTQKLAWKTTCPYVRLNGWNHFVADQCRRFKLGLPMTHTPSAIYQVTTGQISLEGSATAIRLEQPHVGAYYVKSKVPGYQRKFRPAQVLEPFSRPFTLSISYKSNLTEAGPSPSARLSAIIRYDYQGKSMSYSHDLNLDLESDWTDSSADLPVVIGALKSYALVLEITDCQGTLEIDHIEAVHHSQNWAIDPQFLEMEVVYDRGLAQCQRPWNPVVLPAGASYSTKYHS
jgi:hypothetical protein